MANFTVNDELLAKLNDQKVKLLSPVIVYVSILMIIGSFGNIFVCIYYGCKTKRSTNSLFIVALAIFDLTVCVITMPIEIVDLRFFYMFTNVPACKISRLVNHIAADGSATTLLAIAIDRYRRLCRPLSPQLEIRHAKIAVLFAVVFAMILAWPAIIFYKPVNVNVTDPSNRSIVLQGSDCTTTKEDEYRSYLWAFNIVQFVVYVVATMILCVLYSLVGRSIYRYKGRRIKYASTKRIAYEADSNHAAQNDSTKTSVQTVDSSLESDTKTQVNHDSGSEVTVKVSENKDEKATENIIKDEKEVDSEKENTPKIKNGIYTKRQLASTRKSLSASKYKTPKDKTPDIKTVKCTVLMLVITVFFIVGYLPYLVLVIWRIFQTSYEGDILSDAGLVGFQFGIRSYLINSAVNPILYGFFNDNFRNYLFVTFCPCFAKKPNKLSSSASITRY